MNSKAQFLSQSTQIKSLTPMRGIAAIWVMLFHIDVSLFYRDMGALVARTETGFLSKGYLWVDFFFLLSGFVITHVYAKPLGAGFRWSVIGEYLWARFARIYPLHLFTLLLLVGVTPLIAWLFPQVVDGSWKTYFAWSALPSNLMLTQAMNQHVYLSWNMVSWSIAAEWWTYVLVIPVLMFDRKNSVAFYFIYAGIFFSLLCALVLTLPAKNLDITFNYGFWRCFFEFNIGVAIYRLYELEFGRRLFRKDWFAGLVFAVILVIFHWQLQDLFIVPCFCLLIVALAWNQSFIARVLDTKPCQYLGKISYSIYMVHCLWFMVFWFSLPLLQPYLAVPGALVKIAYCLVFISLTLLSAHYSYHFIEIKCQRKLLAFIRPKPESAIS